MNLKYTFSIPLLIVVALALGFSTTIENTSKSFETEEQATDQIVLETFLKSVTDPAELDAFLKENVAPNKTAFLACAQSVRARLLKIQTYQTDYCSRIGEPPARQLCYDTGADMLSLWLDDIQSSINGMPWAETPSGKKAVSSRLMMGREEIVALHAELLPYYKAVLVCD